MPLEDQYLTEVLIIFTLSIAALAFCQRMKVPGIVAFFLTGVIAGPYGLGLIGDQADVQTLAEIGIVFLLFTIGMEMSLKSLFEMRKGMLLGGVIQIGLTIVCVALIAWSFGLPLPVAIFFGMLLAHTSTTVMLTIFQHRGEMDTPPVKLALGISVLQDLSTVPMILMVPMLAGMDAAGLLPSLLTFVAGLVLLAVVAASALWVVPRLLYHVARLKSRELFILTVISLCLGTAWITSHLGLSLALGAFLAGLIISESEYSHEALSTVTPFKDVFTSFFFVSMGMLLDTAFFAGHAVEILVLIAVVIIGKAVIGAVAVLPAKVPLHTAVLTGLAIGQIGEFAFILSQPGIEYGLLSPELEQVFLAVAIGTMALSPFVVATAPGVTAAFSRLPLPAWLCNGERPPASKPAAGNEGNHLIIIGFGPIGRQMARAAQKAGIRYVVVELNPETVRLEKKKGVPIFFGDAINEGVLDYAGIRNARAVAVTIPDGRTAEHITAIARRISPKCTIITRTRYMGDLLPLYVLGADEVVSEEFETTAEILTRVLTCYSLPGDEVGRVVGAMREEKYAMLRQVNLHLPRLRDFGASPGDMEIVTMQVSEGAPIAGLTLAGINLRQTYEVAVIAVARGTERLTCPDGGTIIQAGDACVLIGSRKKIAGVADLFRGA
jgi:CPA2 family monovalent cation:H+ antiporter-2